MFCSLDCFIVNLGLLFAYYLLLGKESISIWNVYLEEIRRSAGLPYLPGTSLPFSLFCFLGWSMESCHTALETGSQESERRRIHLSILPPLFSLHTFLWSQLCTIMLTGYFRYVTHCGQVPHRLALVRFTPLLFSKLNFLPKWNWNGKSWRMCYFLNSKRKSPT